MEEFSSFDGIRIAFEVSGDGHPVLLLHGFASDSARNWLRPKIAPALVSAGYLTIAMDARGHGKSDKPHEVERYQGGAMRRDGQALMDHIGIDRCFALGYSMGARVTLGLLTVESRIQAAVLGGVGANLFRAKSKNDDIADALVADDLSGFEARPLAFRSFADATGADKEALAAAMRAGMERFSPEDLAEVHIPILVIAGDLDTLTGSPHDLATTLGAARAVVVSGDHLNTVFDPLFTKSIIDFFDENREVTRKGP